MKRHTLFLLPAAAATASRHRAIAAPERSRVIRIVPRTGLASLDPIWTAALVTANHGYNMCDTLFASDPKSRPRPRMPE
jgi:hypothetical protein